MGPKTGHMEEEGRHRPHQLREGRSARAPARWPQPGRGQTLLSSTQVVLYQVGTSTAAPDATG